MPETILEVNGLAKYYPQQRSAFGRQQGVIRAVDGVSFQILAGETLAVVGESGCGKSTLAQLILRLLEPNRGSIRFRGREISRLQGRELRSFRRNIQIVFQDPSAALNPRLRVEDLIAEPLLTHETFTRQQITQRVCQLLEEVGLDPAMLKRYPHQFSGGQRQRLGIARALALRPQLIVCDEPISALDLSVRAQILNLFVELQELYNLTYLFITHDLSVVRYLADRVLVMYAGKIVEIAPVNILFHSPQHPYTQALLSVIPRSDPRLRDRKRILLSGDPPNPIAISSGCRFYSRCPHAEPRCTRREPSLQASPVGGYVSCWLYTSKNSIGFRAS